MTDNVKVQITNAVYNVYKGTTEPYNSCGYSEVVAFTKPSNLGTVSTTVKISRVRDRHDITYRLYTDEGEPFMTLFGCWPLGFVADIFIRALEHYYDWY